MAENKKEEPSPIVAGLPQLEDSRKLPVVTIVRTRPIFPYTVSNDILYVDGVFQLVDLGVVIDGRFLYKFMEGRFFSLDFVEVEMPDDADIPVYLGDLLKYRVDPEETADVEG